MMGVQNRYGDLEPIRYVDLFSVPGKYEDGSDSTPIVVLKIILSDPKKRERIFAIFNDAEEAHSHSLRLAINDLPKVEELKYEPLVNCATVNEDIISQLFKTGSAPTFSFIDPFGYKGLTLGLLNTLIKEYGYDCIFFFNYNRINSAIYNPMVETLMDNLFGAERAMGLRNELKDIPLPEREIVIIEALCNAIKESIKSLGSSYATPYVLPFRFCNEQKTITSHHLIFVSKHIRGYEIMKDIMARESSSREQGVPSFEYNQASKRQPFLFGLSQPIEDLAEALCQFFAGKSLTMLEVYAEHHVDTRYIKSNYKKALILLEADGKVQVEPTAVKRRKVNGVITFSDKALVTFPTKNKL